jgi:hypothetical protein
MNYVFRHGHGHTNDVMRVTILRSSVLDNELLVTEKLPAGKSLP